MNQNIILLFIGLGVEVFLSAYPPKKIITKQVAGLCAISFIIYGVSALILEGFPIMKTIPIWVMIILGCIIGGLAVGIANYRDLRLPKDLKNGKTVQDYTGNISVSMKPDIVVTPSGYNYAFYWIQDTNIQPIIEPYKREDQPHSNYLCLKIKNIGDVPCKNIKIEWKINIDEIIKKTQMNYVLNKYNLKINNLTKFISLTKKKNNGEESWSGPFGDTALTQIEYLVSTPTNKEIELICIPVEIEWIYLIGIISMINDINQNQIIECPIIEMLINGDYLDNQKLVQKKYLIKSRFFYISPEVGWDKTKMRSDNIPIFIHERPKDMIRGTLIFYKIE